jgi:hypothetical protein
MFETFFAFIEDAFFQLQVAEACSRFTMSARFTTQGRIGGHPVRPWERGDQGQE